MHILKPDTHVNYEETFMFDCADGLALAESALQRSGIGYVTPVSDCPYPLLQVEGEQNAKRLRRILGKRFEFGKKEIRATHDPRTGMLRVGHLQSCVLIRVEVSVREEIKTE